MVVIHKVKTVGLSLVYLIISSNMVPWKVSGIFKIQGTLFQRNISAKTKSESEKKSKNKFSHTVQLPSTQFPLWVKPQDRAKLDEKINKVSVCIVPSNTIILLGIWTFMGWLGLPTINKCRY